MQLTVPGRGRGGGGGLYKVAAIMVNGCDVSYVACSQLSSTCMHSWDCRDACNLRVLSPTRP